MSDQSPNIPAEVKAAIQGTYSRYLEAKGYKPRYGQRLMIAEIVKGLLADSKDSAPISVIEAGTGTGKTIAYLIAALPLARHLDKKVVISTATITLQEQLVTKDLPDLNSNTDLDIQYVLAKGRGRYLCLSKLDMLLENQDDLGKQGALYEDEQALKLDQGTLALYQEFGKNYASGTWDGDRDSWSTELTFDEWSPVTTDHRQCTNRRCSYFSSCCFFKAREGLDDADCVIANHDLVLADLALGGGAILPAPEETIYIFDEGHHLSDKALQHFGARLRVHSTQQWLKQSTKTLGRMLKEFDNNEAITRPYQLLTEAVASIEPLLQDLDTMISSVVTELSVADQDSEYRRFPEGIVPVEIAEHMSLLNRQFLKLVQQLDKLSDVLKEAISDQSYGIAKELAEQWFPTIGRLLTRAEASWSLTDDYSKASTKQSRPFARWIELHEQMDGIEVELASSPLLAAQTLQEQLWDKCSGAVLTSATLTALGQFERLRMHTGITKGARFSQVPSPFDYANAGRLNLPKLSADPSNTEAHDSAIAEYLVSHLTATSAALVLFTSWRQMLTVTEKVRDESQLSLLVQGEFSKMDMLERHRQQVDQGKGSVLMGLASFSEGVDLPGKYLTEVFIAKIPFAVPGSPIEAALNEWVKQQGKDPFMEIAVPDASIRLVQACGRLIRTETDEGQVTIFDNRLSTRRYGQALLQSLPPFRRIQ